MEKAAAGRLGPGDERFWSQRTKQSTYVIDLIRFIPFPYPSFPRVPFLHLVFNASPAQLCHSAQVS
jgi:hypothetical protein